MSELKISEDKIGDILILDLAGGIRIGAGSVDLHETIRRCIANGEKKVILNLEGVTGIDSNGLGELVGAYASMKKNGGDMKILNLTDRVTELMMITKLLTLFDVFDDETDAMRSFNSEGPRPLVERLKNKKEKS